MDRKTIRTVAETAVFAYVVVQATRGFAALARDAREALANRKDAKK